MAIVISKASAVTVNPYQAPTAAPVQPLPDASGHAYVDQSGRVRLLSGLLVAGEVPGYPVIGELVPAGQHTIRVR